MESLSVLIHSALTHQPTVRAQKMMQEAAQAGVSEARRQYLATPSINLEQANTSDPSYRGDNRVITLRLQQPLWTGGRLDGTLRKAEAQFTVSQADHEEAQQQLALRVLHAWTDATAAHGKFLSYQQGEAVHLRLLGMIERRLSDGFSAQADTDLARSRIEVVKSDMLSARTQRDIALDKLHALTSIKITTNYLERYSSSPLPEQELSTNELLASAREQSPQIARTRALLQIAEAEVTIAKATLSPEVFLRAERQYGNFYQSGQYPHNRIFIGLTSNFGGGLSSLSGLKVTLDRQQAAEENVMAQALILDELVKSDVSMLRMTTERRSSLERVKQTSASVSASWERQFLAGRKQWQDLMNAAREQMQNDVQLSEVIAIQQLTAWRLIILTQGVEALLARSVKAIPPDIDQTK